MELTDREKRMLDGAEGEARARALDYMIQLGRAFDAERLEEIVYVHYPAEMSLYAGEVEDVVAYAWTGARVCVPTTSSTLACDLEQHGRTGCPEAMAEHQKRVVQAHRAMGVAGTYTCTPYLLGYVPPRGAAIASVESSAIIYFNSVLGARTNRGGLFTRYAAITGRYHRMGYLIEEKRKGTHHVRVDLAPEDLEGSDAWSLLGFHVGGFVGGGVPVFEGAVPRRQEDLIALGAALATSGSVTLYHVPGVTPEAATVSEAFRGARPAQEILVGKADLRRVRELQTTLQDDRVDFVCLGCPHYNLEQLGWVAEALAGKKVHPDVRLWVCTNRMTRMQAAFDGIVAVIEQAGGLVIADSCPVESHMRLSTLKDHGRPGPDVRAMATDSTKMSRYVRDLLGCDTALGPREACVSAAVTGRWSDGT